MKVKVRGVGSFHTEVWSLRKADREGAIKILKGVGFIVTKKAGSYVGSDRYVVVAHETDVAAVLEGRSNYMPPLKGKDLTSYVHHELARQWKLAVRDRNRWGGSGGVGVEVKAFAKEAGLPIEIAKRELKKLEKRGLVDGHVSRFKKSSSKGGAIMQSTTFWSPRD